MLSRVADSLASRVILGVLLGGLLVLSYAVLQAFMVPVTWAVILAYSTWPLYERIRRRVPRHPTLSALLMTLLLTAAFVLPVLWVALLVRGEVAVFLAAIGSAIRAGPPELPDFLRDLPWVGPALQDAMERWTSDPEQMRAQVTGWVRAGAEGLIALLGDVGRNAVKFGFALFTVFFLYRDGEQVLEQAQRVLRRFLGNRVDDYLGAIGGTTTGVVWGLAATALAQGMVAGLGYWWTGVPAPVLLGAITAVVAMIPFGTPFAWGSVALWLLVDGQTAAAIGLILWGALVVSWVDNVIRPLVISASTRTPFLLVMFGVLGGLSAFGLIGLFLGPVILAVLMAVWREWLSETAPALVTPEEVRTEDMSAAKMPDDGPPPA